MSDSTPTKTPQQIADEIAADEKQLAEITAAMADAPKRAVEAWAKAKNHTWQFAAARTHERWPTGVELTEAEYDQAVASATGVALR